MLRIIAGLLGVSLSITTLRPDGAGRHRGTRRTGRVSGRPAMEDKS